MGFGSPHIGAYRWNCELTSVSLTTYNSVHSHFSDVLLPESAWGIASLVACFFMSFVLQRTHTAHHCSFHMGSNLTWQIINSPPPLPHFQLPPSLRIALLTPFAASASPDILRSFVPPCIVNKLPPPPTVLNGTALISNLECSIAFVME